jgi:hypothetical protein
VLDHVVVFDEQHLLGLLRAYVAYHTTVRPHFSLAGEGVPGAPAGDAPAGGRRPGSRPAAARRAAPPVRVAGGGVGRRPRRTPDRGAGRLASRLLGGRGRVAAGFETEGASAHLGAPCAARGQPAASAWSRGPPSAAAARFALHVHPDSASPRRWMDFGEVQPEPALEHQGPADVRR